MTKIIKKSALLHGRVKNYGSLINIHIVYVTLLLLITFQGTDL